MTPEQWIAQRIEIYLHRPKTTEPRMPRRSRGIGGS
jgi:hypothetical protein